MAKRVVYFLCALSLCVCVTLLNPISCNAQYFFVFGDSLYDPGNMIYTDPNAKNSGAFKPPYGQTYFGRPTGRFSDGRLVADFIASYLNIPFPPPALNRSLDFTHGASFAAGGAGVFDLNPLTTNLDNQYSNLTRLAGIWRQKLGMPQANRRLKQAVYLMALGGNDYFRYYNDASNVNANLIEMEDYVDQVIGKLAQVVQKMYFEVGARKFMFQTVGCVGCFPSITIQNSISSNGCYRQLVALPTLHNQALYKMARSLKMRLPGFTYSVFDFFSAIGERISHPTNFGFEKGDASCLGTPNCPDPSKYVFWDSGHNTDAANKKFAELMWNGTTHYVYPYTMKDLFAFNPRNNICSDGELCST